MVYEAVESLASNRCFGAPDRGVLGPSLPIGGYLWTKLDVRSSHEARCLASITLHIVDRAELPSAPYMNATRLAMVAYRVVWKEDLHSASVCAV